MENLIFTKLINVSRKVKPISKDQTNSQQNFKYRGVDDLYNALQPLMAEEGIFITSEIVNSVREEKKSGSGGRLMYSIIDMKFNFYAEDGSSVFCITKGEAMDPGDKASNKAMSTALKYALLQMFMIPTQENIDTDQTSHTIIVEEKKPVKLPKGNLEDAIKKMNQASLTKLGVTAKDLYNQFEWTQVEKDKLTIVYNERREAK